MRLKVLVVNVIRSASLFKNLMLVALTSGFLSVHTYAQNSENIVIVGGGLGGLTTLNELKKNRVNAKLFEMRHATGGRVMGVPNANPDGQTFEAGGQLVDKDHLGVARLTQEFNVDLVARFLPGQSQARLYAFGGQILSGPEIMSIFFKTNEAALNKISSDQTNISQLREKIDLMTVDQYLTSTGVTEQLRSYFIAGIESELGKSVGELTALILFDTFSVNTKGKDIQFLPHNDESLVMRGGSQKLTDHMHMRHYNDVETESVLKEVVEKPDGSFELRFLKKGETIWVHTEKLVMAVPSFSLPKISWRLLNNDLPYVPKDIPSFASNSKIFIYFEGRPWGENPMVPILGTDAQGLHYQAWDATNEKMPQKGVITLYTGVHTPLQQEQLVQNFIKQLSAYYPKMSEGYRGYRTYNWRQSYTTADRPGERSRNKARPQQLRNIFLVGEEYDNLHQGYMEGAVRSALKTAQEILTKMKQRFPFFSCLSEILLK